MTNILCIETSEKTCSVALSQDGEIFDELINSEEQSHAKKLTLMIQEILEKNHLGFNKINAVAVSSGPGSYTGLRIGVSTAKGICYAKNIPLISINTLDALREGAKTLNPDFDIYLPNIDARRNEVFMKATNNNGKQLLETKPVILDENPLNLFGDKSCLIAGSGAEKFRIHKRDRDKIDTELRPLASFMCKLAFDKFQNENFEDVAYFEPIYFKAVHTTVSKKKLFGV